MVHHYNTHKKNRSSTGPNGPPKQSAMRPSYPAPRHTEWDHAEPPKEVPTGLVAADDGLEEVFRTQTDSPVSVGSDFQPFASFAPSPAVHQTMVVPMYPNAPAQGYIPSGLQHSFHEQKIIDRSASPFYASTDYTDSPEAVSADVLAVTTSARPRHTPVQDPTHMNHKLTVQTCQDLSLSGYAFPDVMSPFSSGDSPVAFFPPAHTSHPSPLNPHGTFAAAVHHFSPRYPSHQFHAPAADMRHPLQTQSLPPALSESQHTSFVAFPHGRPASHPHAYTPTYQIQNARERSFSAGEYPVTDNFGSWTSEPTHSSSMGHLGFQPPPRPPSSQGP
ncbi:hypothetical protein HDV03_004946 [Kappamyces sp. JEL0829]|nr:hypothetical protein HDV03_004946 [Kappamyces sp. JEL0829]